MDAALLLGRDPVFAWALRKVMADLGLALEHVYTLSEAKLRLERYSYKIILLDNLRTEEVDAFLQLKGPEDKAVFFDTGPSDASRGGVVLLSKEAPLPNMISSLKNCLAQT